MSDKKEVDGYKLYFYECPECGKDNDSEPLTEDCFTPINEAHEKFTSDVECEECGCEFIVSISSL